MIVYLHGFASCGGSRKAMILRAGFPDVRVLAPDYSAHDPGAAIPFLEDFVERHAPRQPVRPALFVGSPTGGYYALLLAKAFAGACVLINPALEPGRQLRPCVGENRNYCTGQPFTVTDAMLDGFHRHEHRLAAPGEFPVLLLLNRDDPVIDPALARERFVGTAQVIETEGGEDPHGFSDFERHLDSIREFWSTCAAGEERAPASS